MKAKYACGSGEHTLARRQFLGALTGGVVVGGLGALANADAAEKLRPESNAGSRCLHVRRIEPA